MTNVTSFEVFSLVNNLLFFVSLLDAWSPHRGREWRHQREEKNQKTHLGRCWWWRGRALLLLPVCRRGCLDQAVVPRGRAREPGGRRPAQVTFAQTGRAPVATAPAAKHGRRRQHLLHRENGPRNGTHKKASRLVLSAVHNKQPDFIHSPVPVYALIRHDTR